MSESSLEQGPGFRQGWLFSWRLSAIADEGRSILHLKTKKHQRGIPPALLRYSDIDGCLGRRTLLPRGTIHNRVSCAKLVKSTLNLWCFLLVSGFCTDILTGLSLGSPCT